MSPGASQAQGQLHTVACSVKNNSLEDNERHRNVVFDLNLDGIQLVLWDGGHCKQVDRAHKEVAVE